MIVLIQLVQYDLSSLMTCYIEVNKTKEDHGTCFVTIYPRRLVALMVHSRGLD